MCAALKENLPPRKYLMDFEIYVNVTENESYSYCHMTPFIAVNVITAQRISMSFFL